MSYEIVYRTRSGVVEGHRIMDQATTFMGVEKHNVQSAFYQKYGFCLPNCDLHLLYAEIGSSNVYDSDNKRARDWVFLGVGTFDELVRRVGIDWAVDIEGGNIQPRGRYSTAEGWIKKIKSLLRDSDKAPFPPIVSRKENQPASWLDKYHLEKGLSLLAALDIQTSPAKDWYRDRPLLDIECRPKNAFELWLFHAVFNRAFGFKNLQASIIPYLGE
ncbi:hypothetical protein [uncultured Photobacterium sp.]|uniref:hypothetical protein n=1 Tax=uncultured Photobacterium sp. TaxID=173973 RepID=UPI00262D4304|nr:hypothetical protein [uncultured Photobacterium sp.]